VADLLFLIYAHLVRPVALALALHHHHRQGFQAVLAVARLFTILVEAGGQDRRLLGGPTLSGTLKAQAGASNQGQLVCESVLVKLPVVEVLPP
jgi:hypothetical protein